MTDVVLGSLFDSSDYVANLLFDTEAPTVQLLKPLSDVSTGQWSASQSGGSLASKIRKDAPSGAPYVQSSQTPVNDPLRVRFDPADHMPSNRTGHRLHFQTGDAPGSQLAVEVYGGVKGLMASATFNDVAAQTDYYVNVADAVAAELASGDYDDLEVNWVAVQGGDIPTDAPSISNMTVDPSSLSAGGGSVTVDADVANATAVYLDGILTTLPTTRSITQSHTFEIIAVGDVPPQAIATVTANVGAGLAITTNSLPAATVGVAYSASLAATGGASPYSWDVASGSLPAGLSLSSGGSITGTPTTSGNVVFTARVTDAVSATATRSQSIDVAASAPGEHDPVWAPSLPPVLPFTQGTAGSIPLTQYASDPDNDPLTFTLESGTLPAGITFNATNCTIAYDGRAMGATIGNPVSVSGVTFGADDLPATNFLARRNGSGVVRWHKFNQGSGFADFDSAPIQGQDALGQEWYAGLTESYFKQIVNVSEPHTWQCELDWPGLHADSPATLSSGTACMRMARPSSSGEGSPQFVWWFAPNRAGMFGAGQKFYLQWRQRFNSAYITNVSEMGGGGIKQMFLLSGLQQDGTDPGNHGPNSMQVFVDTFYQHKMPKVNCDWTGFSSGDVAQTCALVATSAANGEQDYLQNARPPSRDVTTLTGCDCTHALAVGGLYPEPTSPPGCFAYVADEWMTFKLLIDLTGCDPATQPEAWDYPAGQGTGPTGRYRWQGSKVKFWGGRDSVNNGALELIVDFRPGVPGYFPLDAGEQGDGTVGTLRFGQVRFNQQTTGLVPSVHDPLITWIDELILSTEDIPDPS